VRRVAAVLTSEFCAAHARERERVIHARKCKKQLAACERALLTSFF
jgi:hypothetical protein